MENIEVRGRCGGGKSVLLLRPASMELTAGLESPAVGLEAVFMVGAGEEIPPIIEVWVQRGGKELFHGYCDQQVLGEGGQGRRLTISARSPGGLLLDNEALPQTCYGISTRELFRRHLGPYGFTKLEVPREFSAGIFTIPKGMSEWEVFCAFCMRVYARYPILTRENRVVVREPSQVPSLVLSNDPRVQGVRYLSMQETVRRASVVEAVILRDKEGNYSRRIENPFHPGLEIQRKRYIIPATEYVTVPTADGYRRMREAQRGFRSLRGVVPGWVEAEPGDCVAVEAKGMTASAMTLWQKRWRLGDQGEFTTLVLADPAYS